MRYGGKSPILKDLQEENLLTFVIGNMAYVGIGIDEDGSGLTDFSADIMEFFSLRVHPIKEDRSKWDHCYAFMDEIRPTDE